MDKVQGKSIIINTACNNKSIVVEV